MHSIGVHCKSNEAIGPVVTQTASYDHPRGRVGSFSRSRHFTCRFAQETDRIRWTECQPRDAVEGFQVTLGFLGIITDSVNARAFEECDAFVGLILELDDLESPLQSRIQAGRERD